MLRFLAQSALTLLGNALGLLIASILLPDFSISGFGFLVSVGFFTLAHILLSPFVFKMAVKYIPAFRGGIALITTLVSLILTILFTNGLQITSIAAWFVALLVIWFVTVLSGILLPMFLFKKTLEKKTGKKPKTPVSLE